MSLGESSHLQNKHSDRSLLLGLFWAWSDVMRAPCLQQGWVCNKCSWRTFTISSLECPTQRRLSPLSLNQGTSSLDYTMIIKLSLFHCCLRWYFCLFSETIVFWRSGILFQNCFGTDLSSQPSIQHISKWSRNTLWLNIKWPYNSLFTPGHFWVWRRRAFQWL